MPKEDATAAIDRQGGSEPNRRRRRHQFRSKLVEQIEASGIIGDAGEFRLSPAMAGLSATVFSLTYMVSAPVFGGLADRRGRRKVLTLALTAFALARVPTPVPVL